MVGRVERFFQFPALDIIIGRDLQAFSQGMQFLNRMRVHVGNTSKKLLVEKKKELSQLWYHVTLTTHTDKMPEPKNYLVLLSFLLARVLRPRTTQLPFPCLNISLDWSEAVCIA